MKVLIDEEICPHRYMENLCALGPPRAHCSLETCPIKFPYAAIAASLYDYFQVMQVKYANDSLYSISLTRLGHHIIEQLQVLQAEDYITQIRSRIGPKGD